MKNFLFILLTLSVRTIPASAEENVGLSYLGICHPNWPCQESIDAYKNKSKLFLSFLYDRTFGEDCPCIRQIYKDSRPKFTRIHLINGPGLRNARLQKEEIFYGFNIQSAESAILNNDPALKLKFDQVAQRAASDYSQSTGVNEQYVSTCLECNFSELARRKLIDWAKPFFPNAKFVDNPVRGPCLEGLICEKHGSSPSLSPACIVDLDGKDFEAVDLSSFRQSYQTCLAAYLWGYKFNLINPKDWNFIPPRQRKEIPDHQYFNKFF